MLTIESFSKTTFFKVRLEIIEFKLMSEQIYEKKYPIANGLVLVCYVL